ncbi:haloacid dehalogenase type II [Actinomadura atramentaria]|uniref:haloacid dehalogenase type II n=1 Tax=Actinomadura atramentaria TaxID=1990 RepID=UPI000527A342|nr:haloacid dehalogenase type II [Actinomadura atramentaria]
MNVDAVLFDVFGTLTDWRSGVTGELAAAGRAVGVAADWAGVADAWRGAYRPTIARVLQGELPWMPLDALHRLTLDGVLAEGGLGELGDAERAELVRAWHRLPVWPDVVAGLDRLHEGSALVGTLSNGGVGALARLARRAGLRFDCVLSAELARSFKPDPRVYRMAVDALGTTPDRVVLAACHPDDLAAAVAVGLRTAYLPRPLEWGPGAEPVPVPDGVDAVVETVGELADLLG